jgi:hypothetical protein
MPEGLIEKLRRLPAACPRADIEGTPRFDTSGLQKRAEENLS